MTVSVIVPTYNYARFLPDALDSLRKQTYTDWECIVVDDGSTDDTQALVLSEAARDGRVSYVSQPNRGPSAARNRGFAESVGDYIQFLDADDLLQPTKLQAQVESMDADPSIDIIYSDARFFRDSTTDLLPYRVPNPALSTTIDAPVGPLLRALIDRNIMVVEAPLIRRSVIGTVGPFEESLLRMEDWEYWLRCVLAGIRFVADPAAERAILVRAHRHNSTRNWLAMLTSELAVRRWLDGQLDDPGVRRQNWLRTQGTVARIGVLEGKDGHLRAGVRHLISAGKASHRVDWLLLACLLPLLRLLGGDRILSLRRRLLRRPRPW